jgi:superfamily II DNA or RNA helicase
MARKSADDSDLLTGQITALQHQLAAVLGECQRLQEENEQLRARLGLSAQPSLQRVPPADSSQQLFIQSDALPSTNEHSSLEQKITLFRMLFRGREDVYPLLWENRQTGRKGYAPAVKDGWWSRKPGVRLSADDYLPLTEEVIRRHLAGQHTVGVYPLLPDDTCWFLACDFDGRGSPSSSRSSHLANTTTTQRSAGTPAPIWAMDALAYVATCERYGVPAYLERSRSGTGGHVWIFFAAPVPAASARRLGLSLLRETIAMRATLDLTSYDRLFPSQDVLPKGGFGNLIALPLQRQACAVGNTKFLDRELRPWPDQWAFLSTIQRLSPDQLEPFLTALAPVMVGPEAWRTNQVCRLNDQPVPSNIHCTVGTALSIEKAGLPSAVIAGLKHLASLHNPVFYERQKLRLSTYRTPRFIRCYEEDLTHLHLPRGIMEDLQAIVTAAGSKLVVTDRRPISALREFRFRGTLSPIQRKVVHEVASYEQGVLVAPPGIGKTVMACAIIAQRNVPTLVLVHRQPLLNQWRNHVQEWLCLAPSEIGEIRGGMCRAGQAVDLAMIQSLQRHEDLPAFFGRYGLLVVDECHHVPAFSFESCLKQAPVRYVLGLTATPYRRDGLQELITMQCGPIRSTLSPQEGSDGRDLVRELLVRETPFEMPATGEASIHEVFSALAGDTDRTALIAADVLAAVRDGRRCLVLSERRAHCQALAERLTGAGAQPFVLNGSMPAKVRAAMTEAVRATPREQPFLLIATGQYLGEGFDCPQIDTLFLAFPISFKGKLIQYVGRLLRPHPGKTTVQLYDYADVHSPVLKHMHTKRMRTYDRLGFVNSCIHPSRLLD